MRFFDESGKTLIGDVRFNLATLLEGNQRFTVMNKNSEKGTVLL
jgi:hypothetical protein